MKEPKIRFIGFKGEWKTSIIGDIATFSKGRGYSKSDLRSEGNPIVLYGRLYTNYSSVIESVDTFASLQNGSVLTKGNEVIIPGSGETPEDIAVASAVEQKGVILGGDLNVLTFDQKKISPAFAAMSITYSNTHNELSGYAQGKTVVHLHNSSISKGHISYPYIDEQQSISSYFQRLDSLIQSTTKKIESLKHVKGASLQSMFPQEGENTPRVRFKGFEGKWEECLLKDKVNNITTGKLDANAMVPNGKYRFYTCGKEYFKIDKYAFDDEALIISGNGENVGYIHYYNGKFNAYQRTYVLTSFTLNVFYLEHYLKARLSIRINKEKSVANTPYIKMDTISDMNVLYPNDIAEQRAIASYFTSLDRQITLHTQRLEKLKQIKSACLDNMFV